MLYGHWPENYDEVVLFVDKNNSERVCGTTGKANVAPTCAKNTKSQSSNAIAILRGGAAEWMSFRALRGSEGYGACADEGASIAFG